MSGISGLTDEQDAFAAHVGGVFVHACPGAGKTRTIIARLARIAATLPPRHGIAVLSFTNSAVEEFRARCRTAALDTLLKHPSFMGTLDAFVRHFVVLPGWAATSTMRPIILDSWDSLGVGVRLSGRFLFRGEAVSLDLFDPETNVIETDRIGHSGLRNHVREHQVRYQQAAAQRRRGLIQAGYLSASDARVQALRLIRDPASGGSLGRALAARFNEVMVDEGQDCNPLDLEVLSWLRGHGINVTFVCDPDQAIYEFRNGNPAGIRVFKETYPVESRLVLTGNFRSSPAVCQLAATFRSIDQVDASVGSTANVAHPILLLTYGGRAPNADIGRAFLDQVTELGLDIADAIVLAHSGKVAQRAAGGVMGDSNGSSRIESLARNVAEFWSPAATARSREAVIQSVETLLLELSGLREEGEHLLRAIERTGIDRRTHRRRALHFLMNLPKVCGNTDADRLAWTVAVQVEAGRLNLPLPPGTTIARFFQRPRSSTWSNHLRAPAGLSLACAKIHEAKGREYGAVCVIIPPNRAPENRVEALFDSWANRLEAEAKRVLYVGTTRAQHLCALAISADFSDRCVALLEAGQVPFTRRNL